MSVRVEKMERAAGYWHGCCLGCSLHTYVYMYLILHILLYGYVLYGSVGGGGGKDVQYSTEDDQEVKVVIYIKKAQ